MPESILSVLLLLLAVAVIWTVFKLVFKITAKFFSCGCAMIVILAILVLTANFIPMPAIP